MSNKVGRIDLKVLPDKLILDKNEKTAYFINRMILFGQIGTHNQGMFIPPKEYITPFTFLLNSKYYIENPIFNRAFIDAYWILHTKLIPITSTSTPPSSTDSISIIKYYIKHFCSHTSMVLTDYYDDEYLGIINKDIIVARKIIKMFNIENIDFTNQHIRNIFMSSPLALAALVLEKINNAIKYLTIKTDIEEFKIDMIMSVLLIQFFEWINSFLM